MKNVPLTQGQYAIVDDEDYERVTQFKWQCHIDRSGQKYARRTDYSNGGKRLVTMHSFIKPPPVGMINDHRDGNGLNNQKTNLRECTRSQNCMNRRSRQPHGFKGIAFNRQLQKWVAFIRTKGHTYHLGVFIEPISAARAYNQKAIELFGEFAKLNAV